MRRDFIYQPNKYEGKSWSSGGERIERKDPEQKEVSKTYLTGE